MAGDPQFPFALPEIGAALVRVADGVFWQRMPLPFALDHVNVYLFEDKGGWLAVDAGIASDDCRSVWERIFAFIGGPQRLKRLIVTHHHFDHVGLAAHVQRRSGCDVLMSAAEVAEFEKSIQPEAAEREARLIAHYQRLGCTEAEAVPNAQARRHVEDHVDGAPQAITGLEAGGRIDIGGAEWRVATGGGHSVASLIMTRADNALMIAGDQILTGITPFIGAMMNNRDEDPLKDYLAFLDQFGPGIDNGTLILPGHRQVFRGGRDRCATVASHHHARCDKVLACCADGPTTIRAMLPALFARKLDGVLGLALAETLAHVNYLAERGSLRRFDRDGLLLAEKL